MGGGSWDVGTYDDRVSHNQATGRPTFYHSYQIQSGQRAAGVHQLLDPKRVAGSTSPFAGTVMREVVISAEHPRPTPIAIVLDVTGSNIEAATIAHGKMPELLGVLQRRGYVEDPELNFCATGDANSDHVPLQVGAFESDNRIDQQLEAIYLEGNGGGQVHETYEIAAYFLARHTHLEPLVKQGRKGYVFFIGDEMPYQSVRRQHIQSIIGDNLESDISTEQIFAELKDKFEVFFLFQKQGSYHESEILPTWRKLLGERAIVLDDPAAVCECIAGVLGLLEGGRDSDQIRQDLLALGADPLAVQAASSALARIEGATSPVVKVTDGNLSIDNSGGGSTRL